MQMDFTTELEYTRFEGSIFGSPNNNFSSAIRILPIIDNQNKITDRDSKILKLKK